MISGSSLRTRTTCDLTGNAAKRPYRRAAIRVRCRQQERVGTNRRKQVDTSSFVEPWYGRR